LKINTVNIIPVEIKKALLYNNRINIKKDRTMKLRDSEIYRYAGFKGNTPDRETVAKTEELKKEATSAVTPLFISREADFVCPDGNTVVIDGVKFRSQKLSKLLSRADKVLLFAATLGVESDRILRKYSVSDSSKYVLAQAVLTEMIENCCDSVLGELLKKYQKSGYSFLPRYSPGYGDLPLEYQREFFSLMDITKRIGVTLNGDCLMTPSKSVTAFIGITREALDCPVPCELCDKTDCQFRRN